VLDAVRVFQAATALDAELKAGRASDGVMAGFRDAMEELLGGLSGLR